MNKKIILAVLAGGAIGFIWSSISWMLLPWHQPTMNTFKDEDSVGRLIKEAASEKAGIYTYPGWTDDEDAMKQKHDEGPFVFASVVPKGVGSDMGPMMIGGILVSFVGAAMLLTLMLCVPDNGWKARALVGAIAALFVSVVPALMNWNWWHFPLDFVLVGIFDNFISWTLAGLVMAKITAGKFATAE